MAAAVQKSEGGARLFEAVVSAEYCEGVRAALDVVNVAVLRETCRQGRAALPAPEQQKTVSWAEPRPLVRAARQGEALFVWGLRRVPACASEEQMNMFTQCAAQSGFVGAIAYMAETFEAFEAVNGMTAVQAAANGHLPLVKWMHTHRPDMLSWEVCLWAARTDQTETMAWMEAQGYMDPQRHGEIREDLHRLVVLASSADTPTALVLLERSVGVEAMGNMVRSSVIFLEMAMLNRKCVEVLRWLCDRDAPTGGIRPEFLAVDGNVEALEFLLVRGVPVDLAACLEAVDDVLRLMETVDVTELDPCDVEILYSDGVTREELLGVRAWLVRCMT